MSKVDCKNCQFYHNGRCEELGEYTTPGECECSWFAWRVNKKRCVAEIAKNAKQTVFHRITASPEVLAEKLVYLVKEKADSGTYNYWSSTISCDVWLKKSEAIAATVKKLKEVAE